MTDKLDRRNFLKNGLRGVAGMGLLGALGAETLTGSAVAAAAPDAKAVAAQSAAPKAAVTPVSHLALARNPKVVIGPAEFDKAIVEELLNRSVCLLSGEKKPKDAWEKLIHPTKSDVVGIKVNMLGGPACRTAPELAFAVAECLKSIGVDKSKIIIWDRGTAELGKCGYPTSAKADDVRCMGTHPDSDFSATASKIGDKEIHLSRILSDEISILINLPIMKDHGGAGITGALKNHYGSFKEVFACHSNNCDPDIANLNALPEIRNKTRLIIFDAMCPLYDGGPVNRPANRWNYGGICAGTDPVATDAFSLSVIEAKRKEVGLDPIGDRAKHIQTAEGLGLGCADMAKIKVLGDSVA